MQCLFDYYVVECSICFINMLENAVFVSLICWRMQYLFH